MVSLRNKKNYPKLSSNTLSYLELCYMFYSEVLTQIMYTDFQEQPGRSGSSNGHSANMLTNHHQEKKPNNKL